MSEMSDLFDSLDAGDLDEIAGKLNVTPTKKAPKPIVEEAEAPVVEQKKEKGPIDFDRLDEQIADLFNTSEFPVKEMVAPKPQPKEMVAPKPQPKEMVAPKPQPRVARSQKTSKPNSYNESLMETTSKYIAKQVQHSSKYEPTPLRESRSVEDRIKLIEQDLFRVQAQATPNTLVAGIGASLDSGGGAVWLWDLEDVNIGTPLNGQYPTIANGASLVYKSASNKWEAVVQAGGSGGTIYTDSVFLLQSIPSSTWIQNLQTLPVPQTTNGDVETQADANTWFRDSLLDIDERLGGVDGNTDIPGNLDMEGTENVAAIRRFGATESSKTQLDIQVGQSVDNLTTTTSFLQGSTTSLVPLSVEIPTTSTLTGTSTVFSVTGRNADNSLETVFTVSTDEIQFFNQSTFVRPTAGAGITGFNVKGTLEGNVSTTSDLLYLDVASDATAGADAIKYYGAITDENDIVTKKYVDNSTGGSTAGVTKIVAGTNVSIEPEGGTGEVTINATGSGSAGWATAGDTALTGACDIELTWSNNAVRFLGNTEDGGGFNTVMMRFKNVDDEVEFGSVASFNKGVTIPGNQNITLEDTVDLVMKDGAGTAFEMKDASNNVFMRVNTAATPGINFYENISNLANDSVRCKFNAYEPPGGSHFYLQTTDADALDFIDETTNEIYLRFNTNTKAVQISDADVELDVTGTVNAGRLESLRWDVTNNAGAYSSGDIYIADNDVDALDIRNVAGGNPFLRFTTTTDAQKTVFYHPIQTNNGSLILDDSGSITTTQTATFNGAIVHSPTSNAAVDFGANDGTSARSMVRFNRRVASTAGQTDFVIRGYRPDISPTDGVYPIQDIFQVKDNNPATEGDEILYYGETDNDDYAIQTKKSVTALIGSGGGGVSFTFKGTTDVTSADPPAGVVAGDYYANSTAGNAGANWTGIDGDAVALNQLVIYKADGNWVLGGGVAGAYLPISGGTVTGATTFDSTLTVDGELTSTAGIIVDRGSAPNNIIDIKLAGTRTAQIIANGNAQFKDITAEGVLTGDSLAVTNGATLNGACTVKGLTTLGQASNGKVTTVYGNLNVVPASGGDATAGNLIVKNAAGDTVMFKASATGAVTCTGVTNSGNSSVGGTLGVTGAFTANSTSLFKGGTITVEGTSPLTVGSQATFNTYPVLMKAGFAAGVLSTGADCAIEGDLTIQDPSAGSFEGALIIKEASGTPKVKLKASGFFTESRIVFNGSQVNQAIKAEGNVNKTLSFLVSNATGGSAADNTFNTVMVLGKNKVTFPRIGSAASFVIQGIREDDADRNTTDAELLTVYRNTVGGTNADAINYYGRTAGAENIQTKTSVNQLILEGMAAADLNLLTGGTIKSTGGSASTSGNLAVQATGASTGGNFYIRDAFSADKVTLAQSGDISLGENLIFTSGTNRIKTIQAYHASNNPQLVYQTKKGTANPVDVFSALAAEFTVATTLRVAPDINTAANTFQVDTAGKISNKVVESTTQQWTVNRNAQLTFNATTSEAAISKVNGKNQSGNDYNRLLFYCGNTNSSANAGVKNPMLALTNSNGTYIAQLPTGIRQQYDTDVCAFGSLSTTTLAVSSATTSSTTSTVDGEELTTITQTAATVPGIVTFTGDNIHSGDNTLTGTNTHTGDNTHQGRVIFEDVVESRKNLRMINCEDAETGNAGAQLFKWKSSTTANNQAHILFQGSGDSDGSNPGVFTYARDTATNNVAATDKYFSLIAPKANEAGVKTVFHMPIEVPTPTDDTHAVTKSYVDSHSNSISGGQQSGTFTATFDGPFAPSSKQTATGHYRKIGDLTHVTIHATNLNLTNYSNEIRITGLPFKPDPDISGGNHIGKIHGVSFMVNNAHADDGFIAVATHNATYGNHIVVFSEQVDQVTHYLNSSPAKVTISITYIAE